MECVLHHTNEGQSHSENGARRDAAPEWHKGGSGGNAEIPDDANSLPIL